MTASTKTFLTFQEKNLQVRKVSLIFDFRDIFDVNVLPKKLETANP